MSWMSAPAAKTFGPPVSTAARTLSSASSSSSAAATSPLTAGLIGMINAIDPTLDITMTTNGVLLRQKAQALKEAGLKRINISLDTLRMDTFKDMARSDAFDRVMDGITAAREAGLWPIKLNMVVMKGHNDDEVVDLDRTSTRLNSSHANTSY